MCRALRVTTVPVISKGFKSSVRLGIALIFCQPPLWLRHAGSRIMDGRGVRSPCAGPRRLFLSTATYEASFAIPLIRFSPPSEVSLTTAKTSTMMPSAVRKLGGQLACPLGNASTNPSIQTAPLRSGPIGTIRVSIVRPGDLGRHPPGRDSSSPGGGRPGGPLSHRQKWWSTCGFDCVQPSYAAPRPLYDVGAPRFLVGAHRQMVFHGLAQQIAAIRVDLGF